MAHFDHDDAVCSDILLYRLLEMLVAHGMDSTLCQELLRHEGIQRALAHACRPETRALARQCETPFLRQGFLVFCEPATYGSAYRMGASSCSDQCPGASLSRGGPQFPGLVAAGDGAPPEEFEAREREGRTLFRRLWPTTDEAVKRAFASSIAAGL